MGNRKILEDNIFKYVNLQLLINTAKDFANLKIDSDKLEIKITEDYGIYSHNYGFENIHIGKTVKNNDYSIFGFDNVNTVIDVVEKLYDAVTASSFFGAVVMCKIDTEEKYVPYNPLSYNFIAAVKDNKIKKIHKMFLYYLEGAKVDENDVDQIEDSILTAYANLGNIAIKIENNENSNSYINLLAPRDSGYEDLGLHLNDLHKSLKYTGNDNDIVNEGMPLGVDFILNSNVSDSTGANEDSLPSNWCIEHHVIYDGVVSPTYGLYGKVDASFIPIAPIATKHPNISENGSSYCTGINQTYSITGISQLSYGNLTSALNSSIGLDNSLTVAKAYQRIMLSLLLEMKI